MRWRDQASDGSGQSDVNMTPLIDVSLVLVVMLLLATPLAFESGFAVRRTEATTRKASQAESPPRLEIRILSEDRVQVNKDTVPRRVLGEVIRPLLAGPDPCQVTVDCEDGVSHGTFISVLDVAKLNGAGTIAVVGG